jgi:hypothetical protein
MRCGLTHYNSKRYNSKRVLHHRLGINPTLHIRHNPERLHISQGLLLKHIPSATMNTHDNRRGCVPIVTASPAPSYTIVGKNKNGQRA